MSQPETVKSASIIGCELPEHLRRYYLDVMDINCWQSQNQTVLEQDDVTEVVESVAVPDETFEPAVANISLQWQALNLAVSSCERCESLCQSRTQGVIGSGNTQADVLIIGEAPDESEDKQGEPFIGQIGDLLTAMLKAIKLTRENVYMTNIVKCRSPQDRDPLSQEAENCSAFLRQQIALLQPKVILVFGRVAAQNLFLTKTAIGKLRGESLDYQGIPVIVTYHPTYLLHKPSEKRKAWQDLQRLQSLMATWQ